MKMIKNCNFLDWNHILFSHFHRKYILFAVIMKIKPHYADGWCANKPQFTILPQVTSHHHFRFQFHTKQNLFSINNLKNSFTNSYIPSSFAQFLTFSSLLKVFCQIHQILLKIQCKCQTLNTLIGWVMVFEYCVVINSFGMVHVTK